MMNALSASVSRSQTEITTVEMMRRSSFDFFSMSLGPSAAISIDASIIGGASFKFPGDVLTTGKLADEICDLMFEMHRAERSLLTSLLLVRNRIQGVVSIALGNLSAIRSLQRSPVPGYVVNKDVPALEFFEGRIDTGRYSPRGRYKALVALWFQNAVLRLIDWVGAPRPVFQISDELPEGLLRNRRFWRIRGFPLLLGRSRALSERENCLLDRFTVQLADRIIALTSKHGIQLSQHEQNRLRTFLGAEMRTAFTDYLNLRDWFSGGVTDFFGGSVAGYGRALLALIARESGGEAHGTVHGGNVFAETNAANVFEFLNASVSWVPSQSARRNAHEMMRVRCPDIGACEIRVQEKNDLIRYGRNQSPVGKIRTVLVMGKQVVLQVAGLSVLPPPCYVDVEKRLTDVLLSEGFDVIYKPHPENSWRGHKEIFNPRVHIEAGRYENMDRSFEAVVHVHPSSSTFITDMGSNRHIFLIADGWHDAFWLPSVLPLLERRCEMIPGRIDMNGRVEFDRDELISRMKNPKAVDPLSFAEYIGADVGSRTF